MKVIQIGPKHYKLGLQKVPKEGRSHQESNRGKQERSRGDHGNVGYSEPEETLIRGRSENLAQVQAFTRT